MRDRLDSANWIRSKVALVFALAIYTYASPAQANGVLMNAHAVGGLVTIEWPTNAGSYVLQSASSLCDTSWASVPVAPSITNGISFLTVSNDNQTLFFRLSSPPAIFSVQTEGSSTPTNSVLTLNSFQNAVQIWTGETPKLEPFFDLWVSISGNMPVDIRLYRWQSRIINAAAGASIAFGTKDGRSIQAAPIAVNSTLDVPSGQTNLLTIDEAGPPIWAPRSPHLILASCGQAITIVANPGAERTIFEREFDGSVWTYPRWIIVPTNSDRTVQCCFRDVALASFDGQPIEVITHPYAVATGWYSNELDGAFPIVWTNTWYCTNAFELDRAIGSAVCGDQIVLADGTYPLDAIAIVHNTFTNNEREGFKGGEGILIRSESGNRDSCIITCAATNNSGFWSLNQSGASNATYFRDLTFDFSNSSSEFQIAGGHWTFGNVRFTGSQAPGSDAGPGNSALGGQTVQELISIESSVTPVFADFIECEADHSLRDCWSGSGYGSLTGGASQVRLINCSAFVSGPNRNDQLLTTHGGIALDVYGGSYSDSIAPVANGAITDYCNLFFTKISGGPRDAGTWQDFNSFGCHLICSNSQFVLQTNSYVAFSRIEETNEAAGESIFSYFNEPYVIHNVLSSRSGLGRAFFEYVSISTNNIGNVMEGFSEAVRLNNSVSNIVIPQAFIGNSFVNCGNAISGGDDNLPFVLTNNVTSNAMTSVSADGAQSLGGNYNVWGGRLDNYTHGANDFTNQNANLTEQYFPVAGGNCDTNGFSGLGYVGDADPYGLVWIYAPNLTSRGARSIPRVYRGAVLYPDEW